MTSTGVHSDSRYTNGRQCPICHGRDSDPRGAERRCFGFLSNDGDFAHCSREEHAGSIKLSEGSNTFGHRLAGPCSCGTMHREAEPQRPSKRIVKEYNYHDEFGVLLYQVVRYEPKAFRQRKPDGNGGWLWKLEDTRRVLYRLDRIVESDQTVYVVEGEKDVEAMETLGLVATCNPQGAGKWHAVADCARDALRGRDVVVIADADDKGREHAADVVRRLTGIAASTRIIEPRVGKDASDWIASGATAEEIGATEPATRQPPSAEPDRTPTGPRAKNTEPVRLAEAFRSYQYELHGEPTLVRWARAWWAYDGTRYVEHDEESLDRDLIKFLDVVVSPKKQPDGGFTYERVTSKAKTISEVRKASLHVFPLVGSGAPRWTSAVDGDPDPIRLAPCANGILNLDNRELIPRTPRFFSTTAIGCAWDPAAEAPQWLAFLKSLWGEDTDSIHALQQMFGYFLTPDTSQQKLFALIGLPRSGKGTIARVLRALLGSDAVVNPTLDGLEDTFGLQPLVGKTLAIIGDARLGGAKEQTRVVERLLSISGEDAILINRKNTGMVNVRLRTRVLLLSNELPRLYDTSGALASRFVILELKESFLNREDVTLEAKLLSELPGILRWAVDGYESLAESGRFVTPQASLEAQETMKALSSPMSCFLADCTEEKVGVQVEVDVLFNRYREWCSGNGTKDPGSKQWFGRNLRTLKPGLSISKPIGGNGKQVRVYVGLGLA